MHDRACTCVAIPRKGAVLSHLTLETWGHFNKMGLTVTDSAQNENLHLAGVLIRVHVGET